MMVVLAQDIVDSTSDVGVAVTKDAGKGCWMAVGLSWGMAVLVAGIALEEQHRMLAACRTEGRVVAETGSLHHTVIEVVRTRSKEVHFQYNSSHQYCPARLIGY